METPPLIALVGQTAVGKSHAALALAPRLDAEILMADSMAVYRGMDIGTAKPDTVQRAAVPHHGLDLADINRDFSVALYLEAAHNAIAQIASRGRTILVVCGTGLYLKALLEGLPRLPSGDEALRAELRDFARDHGPAALHARLALADPRAAEAIEQNNVKRVVRALEVFQLTGRPFSEHLRSGSGPRTPALVWGLRREKTDLVSRIDFRVDKMFSDGLIEEVEGLLARYGKFSRTAGQAIGYRQVLDFLDGAITRGEAADAVKRATRLYAKRQMTWFRRGEKTRWLDLAPGQEITEEALELIARESRAFLGR